MQKQDRVTCSVDFELILSRVTLDGSNTYILTLITTIFLSQTSMPLENVKVNLDLTVITIEAFFKCRF